MKPIETLSAALFRLLPRIAPDLRSLFLTLVTCLAAALPLAAQQSGGISIDVANPGPLIPRTLFGVFFEEINFAGEGGLYGELIRNRSFGNSASPDFWTPVTQGTSGWVVNSGSWNIDHAVIPGTWQQTANGNDYRSTYINPDSSSWQDYTLTLQARKQGGSEGFLIMFDVADSNNWFWWNIGGWNNTAHAITRCVNDTKTTLNSVPGSINTGQWYDIRIVTQDDNISCYLDDVLVQSATTFSRPGGIGLSTWNTQAEFRNIVVTGPADQTLYQSDFDAPDVIPGQISVDSTKPLNATNPESLKLTQYSTAGSMGAANSGYWGIPLTAGDDYALSLHACADTGFTGLLTARLESADGATVYTRNTFSGLTTDWQHLTATLTPGASDTNARLVISIDQPGTVWMDVVSLFPKATYKNRANGMRADLATAVADMKPAFLRFPGGCYVEGNTLANSFRWKNTIGDVSGRPGHWNLWGYTSTDGLGYHEYLQYCEDINAEPLYCINAGMSHTDVVPLNQMGEYVQDALDAIEYANGDTSTTWGAKRAANGHPLPFNMKFIEVGNENGGTNYNDRYALFYDAIKAAHPEMRIVSCVWGGTPTSRPLDLIDEHYYTNPATFLGYATKYDNYSRSGPKVFVGEYAVTSGYGTLGNLSAALGEAAFMTGIERNCDVVEMASYAPLFANLNQNQWKPDAIYFDNSRWFGTPAYQVQKMFSNNMGSAVLPVRQDFASDNSGGIGLSTWNTQAEFRNIIVTDSSDQFLYQSDFDTTGASEWSASSGTWSIDSGVSPGAYLQSANGQDYRSLCTVPGSAAWKNYTLTLQARKVSGSEGFLIMFHVADSNNWLWWNIGGWGNTSHAIESCVNGAKATGPRVGGSINSGQWYDIRIAIQGGVVNCYLNDVLTQTFTFPSPVFSVASMDDNTRQIILKTVNPTDGIISADIALAGVASIAPSAQWTVLTSNNPADENSLENPDNIIPVTDSVSTPSPQFTLALPAYSVNILRIQTPALAPQSLTVDSGNQQAALHWSESAGASAYTVMRSTSSGSSYEVIATGITGTSFTDSGLTNGTGYYYVVCATNSAGAGPVASEAAATPESPPITEAWPLTLEILPGGGGVNLTSVPSVIGHAYQLQLCGDLSSGSWKNVGEPIPGTGEPLVFNVNFDSTETRCFYRILITR